MVPNIQYLSQNLRVMFIKFTEIAKRKDRQHNNLLFVAIAMKVFFFLVICFCYLLLLLFEIMKRIYKIRKIPYKNQFRRGFILFAVNYVYFKLFFWYLFLLIEIKQRILKISNNPIQQLVSPLFHIFPRLITFILKRFRSCDILLLYITL